MGHHSHTTPTPLPFQNPLNYGNGMGPAYKKGVPLLGVAKSRVCAPIWQIQVIGQSLNLTSAISSRWSTKQGNHKNVFGAPLSKKGHTSQRITQQNTPTVNTLRGDTTQKFPRSGNAQQQLRWAASSAAALLMSFVVTLQPAQET